MDDNYVYEFLLFFHSIHQYSETEVIAHGLLELSFVCMLHFIKFTDDTHWFCSVEMKV